MKAKATVQQRTVKLVRPGYLLRLICQFVVVGRERGVAARSGAMTAVVAYARFHCMRKHGSETVVYNYISSQMVVGRHSHGDPKHSMKPFGRTRNKTFESCWRGPVVRWYSTCFGRKTFSGRPGSLSRTSIPGIAGMSSVVFPLLFVVCLGFRGCPLVS